MMNVVIGADHGGFELKGKVVSYLEGRGILVSDVGPLTLDPDDDYPDFAARVAKAVAKDGSKIGQKSVLGIIICRSAGGVIIAANKIKGVRAVSVYDEKQAKHARQHNDANIIGLSGDWTPEAEAKKLIMAALETPYSNEPRHTRRLKKIAEMEK